MTTTVPSETRAKTVKQLRRIRVRRLVLRLLVAVGVPTLLAALYYGFWVQPEYESVTTFTVQNAEGSAIGGGALEALLLAGGGGGGHDVMLVLEYIRSRDMLDHLVREHRWREHYENPTFDRFSRLSAHASREAQYEFYLDHIDVELDAQSGVLVLKVRAFSQQKAFQLGQAMLAASERMVNELADRARHDRMQLAQHELNRSEARLTRARQALIRLQAERGELDPRGSAESVLSVRSQLEGGLALARAELATMSQTLQPDAEELRMQRRRVAALQQQVDEQNRRLAGSSGGISATMASFEPVAIEKEFAQRAYESALTSLELARVDASRQHRYLVHIAGPSRPQDPAYPNFWYSILTVLLASFALLGIGTLLIASVREHANV